MTGNARVRAAQALRPLLDTFHGLNGLILRAISRVYVHESVGRLVLDFDQVSLVVEANSDVDTIEIGVEDRHSMSREDYIDASRSVPWSKFVGEPFGWGWLAINQQGYCDSILLSFHGITPQLLLNVIASSIKESVIERCDDLRH
jgi:Family of unknown function (DUF6334)